MTPDSHAQRKAKVYEAALALTSQGVSPAAMTIQQLADAAGIGKGTVYEYFSSKEEILQGLGHYCFEQENARVAERFDRCRTLVDLENELVARLQAAGEIDPGLTMDACRTSIFCTVTGGLIALCCSAGSGTSLPALPALPQNLREALHRSLQAPK